MNARILQTVLLTAALLIAVLNPVFNGLSLLALGAVYLTGMIAYRSRTSHCPGTPVEARV